MVPGHGPDGTQLRRHRLHQEPIAADGPRRGTGPVRRGGVGSRRGGAAVGRALGVDGTLIEAAASPGASGLGTTRRPPQTTSGQPVGGLPGGAPEQPDARQHHGPRGAPAAQRGQARKPEWRSWARP